MQNYGVFDIIGPRMVGPSSSHTAGAAKLGLMARKIAGEDVKKAKITLYGSFATTGPGHGTDKAVVAGILGLAQDDPRLRYSMLLAREADVDATVELSDEPVDHPNTARIELEGADGKKTLLIGQSVGGGNILVTNVNGLEMKFSGEYPTLIVRHTDVPGVINMVTLILAKEQINVAFMRVFRQGKRGGACMVIETDTPVGERVRQLIKDWCDPVTEVFSV
ncbi:MAG: L-serine dehydratase, beta chain [Firmicutes bacterium ADurb.Bin248]|nr:MAG: L-serine dehydratase, beta chain [Firmicutes bacterium ADurb.Bin248]HOG00655.1 L-serine ammonia-lyase, iron-sulfur-dependent subunit beta [Clostridia bacterium]HPK15816.1 L-serine ammonia-lyase, iron-sulfur-dependent subunit beta [Clostridia bacterium]